MSIIIDQRCSIDGSGEPLRPHEPAGCTLEILPELKKTRDDPLEITVVRQKRHLTLKAGNVAEKVVDFITDDKKCSLERDAIDLIEQIRRTKTGVRALVRALKALADTHKFTTNREMASKSKNIRSIKYVDGKGTNPRSNTWQELGKHLMKVGDVLKDSGDRTQVPIAISTFGEAEKDVGSIESKFRKLIAKDVIPRLNSEILLNLSKLNIVAKDTHAIAVQFKFTRRFNKSRLSEAKKELDYARDTLTHVNSFYVELQHRLARILSEILKVQVTTLKGSIERIQMNI